LWTCGSIVETGTRLRASSDSTRFVYAARSAARCCCSAGVSTCFSTAPLAQQPDLRGQRDYRADGVVDRQRLQEVGLGARDRALQRAGEAGAHRFILHGVELRVHFSNTYRFQ
jgi:hypothetical protein